VPAQPTHRGRTSSGARRSQGVGEGVRGSGLARAQKKLRRVLAQVGERLRLGGLVGAQEQIAWTGRFRPRPRSRAGHRTGTRKASLHAELARTGLNRPRLLSSDLDQLYVGLGSCMSARQAICRPRSITSRPALLYSGLGCCFYFFLNILH
jgi:hypothetical protein